MPLTLTRILHLTNPLQHGDDVKSVQHLLNAKGFPVDADGWYGPETAAACVTAKKRLKYPKAAQVPSCGQPLVDALEAHPPFPPLPLPPARVRYVATLHRALNEKADWRYSQTRPIPHDIDGSVVTDCSGAVTVCAEVAKCPDPNGRKFDGLGFTGTLLDHCSQIVRGALKPGDLIVFGRYPGHHVCAALNAADDPMLFSHGRPGDPRQVSLSVEAGAQAANGHTTLTYLRFLP